MQGRSNRARGICEAILYVNTGEKGPAYRQRIQTTRYSETAAYIRLLMSFQKLQANPTEPELYKSGKPNPKKFQVISEVEVLCDEWNEGSYVTSLKELNRLVELKDALLI